MPAIGPSDSDSGSDAGADTNANASGAAFPFPVWCIHDRSASRLEAAVDVLPAGVDDLTVEVSASRLRITIERDDERAHRTVSPPDRYRFAGDRSAVYNNGVLSVRLETRRQYR